MSSRDISFQAVWLALMASALSAQPLPGTAPLATGGDLALQMVEGIDRYLMRELAASPAKRPAKPDRERLREILGAVDPRVPFEAPSLDATAGRPASIASAPGYTVQRVSWPVFPDVSAEGLLLSPVNRAPRMRVVVLGDAGQTPEMLAGLDAGVDPAAQMARRLAESGCLVLVPILIDRSDAFSENPAIRRFTNQPHREWVYRMAYEAGRHIIGYEIAKVQAAVDWFRSGAQAPTAVYGYGEGGLVALYAAALDPRIERTAVSGCFRAREGVWREPIYRNVWGLLTAYGDAEVASMIAPRTLVVETSRHPEVAGPPAERQGRSGAAPGRLTTPEITEVQAEIGRARELGATVRVTRTPDETIEALTGRRPAAPLQVVRSEPRPYDSAGRMRRQLDQLVEHTQRLVRRSTAARRDFTATRDASTLRRYLWEEILGKLPPATEPLAAESRLLYDRPSFRGWEVRIPVLPDVFAYGILLLPRDLKPGERRPIVVTQHGLEGRPQDLVEPSSARAETAYQRYAARLAERGYIVYAPQNPYIFGKKFRVLQRKANPLKLSLFSFIVAQHARTLEWLRTQPFTAPGRIGFYGLSYGGKTAMRVPPLLDDYALSICSGDFNEWTWKVTSVDEPFSYMYTQEYDMLEFNMANTLAYAEMAALIAPRPFMVERGHNDGVGIDEWVAYEFAKVRRHYARLGIPERTSIEFFNGPHQIHGVGTFEFLDRFLGPSH